jgi:ATP-binding cassette, subfamily B, multidrug efflux pump
LKNLLYLNKFFIKYKWRLLLGVLFVSLSNYFGILIPQKIREALDFAQKEVLIAKNSGTAIHDAHLETLNSSLIKFAIIVVGFMVLKGVFMFLMRQTIIVNSRLIEYDMRKELFDHMQSLDTAYFKRNRTGDLMARITEDVNKVRNYLGPGILYGINLLSLFVFTIYAMFSVNAKLAIFTLIPLPFLSLSIYYVSSLINKKSTDIQQQLSKLTSISQEVFSGIRVIKSYGKEEPFNEYFAQENSTFRKKNIDLGKVNAYFFPLMILLINISTLIVLIVGSFYIADGSVSPGNIAEFIIYVNMLTWPVTSIGWIASIIQEAEASQARLNELLASKNELHVGQHIFKEIKGQIVFDKVNFTYPDSGIEAMKNVSFTIQPGERVAFVGRTASGKSTIAELLLGMYDIHSGTISIDGIDIKEVDRASLRKRIGYVPQDVFLFSDTVANNIAFGTDITDVETIDKYAEFAAVKDDILRLPEQYATVVGERGVSLSGGQKQRISIARAFIKQPDLVILDDCLSAVDTETENSILQYLNVALQNKTSIVITHRVTSLVNFDKIFVIEDGTIIESGTHDTLIDHDGYYAELYQKNMMEAV